MIPVARMEERFEKRLEREVFGGKRARYCVKATGGIKKNEKFKSQSDLGKENTGLGALRVIMRGGGGWDAPKCWPLVLSPVRLRRRTYLSM